MDQKESFHLVLVYLILGWRFLDSHESYVHTSLWWLFLFFGLSLYGFENFLFWDNFLIAVLGLFYGSAQLFEGLVDACKDTKYQGVEC